MDGITLYTAKDLQSLFKIGKNKAYELMKSSGFPTIKLNDRMYVEDSELRKWLEKYCGREYYV